MNINLLQKTLVSFTCLFLLSLTLLQCKSSVSDSGNSTSEQENLQGVNPVLPAHLAVNQSTTTELHWETVKNAKEYLLQISRDENFESGNEKITASSSGPRIPSAAAKQQRDSTGTENAAEVDTLLSRTFYTSSSLTEETTYYWRILPIADNFTGDWSGVQQFSTAKGNIPPKSVELVSPVEEEKILTGDVVFKWDPVAESEGYFYQMSPANDFENIVVDSVVTNAEIEIQNLKETKKYYWRVSPILKSSASSWGRPREFEITDTAPIRSVELDSPDHEAVVQSASVSFSWEKMNDLESYQLQISGNTYFDDSASEEKISGTSYKSPELDNEHVYYWRVRALDGNETGNWSQTRSFKISADPGNGSQGDKDIPKITLTNPGHEESDISVSPAFEWKKHQDASKYEFQLAEDKSFSDLLDSETVSENTHSTSGLDHNEVYYWRVRGINQANTGAWSNIWEFTTVPEKKDEGNSNEDDIDPGGNGGSSENLAKIALSSPENGEENQPVTLSFDWDEIKDAEKYQFQLATDQSFSSKTTDKSVDAPPYKVNELNQNKTFYWRVRAINDQDKGNWSDIWKFTTGEAAQENPPPDDNLARVSLSNPENDANDTALDLSFEWKGVSGAEEYQFQLASDPSFSEIVANKTPERSPYEVNELNDGQTFYWRVRAVNSSEKGAWSDVWKFTTREEEQNGGSGSGLEKVALISPDDNTTETPVTLDFDWEEVSDAEGYRYQLSTNQSFSSLTTDKNVGGPPYKVNEMNNGQTFYWRVRAENGQEQGEWSEVRDFTTEYQTIQIDKVILQSPANRADNQSTSISLSWSSAANAEGYDVQVAADNSFSQMEAEESTTQLSFNLSGLQNSRTYYWRVRGTSNNTDGEWSDVWEFTTENLVTTPPPNPGAFVRIRNGNFEIDGNVFRFSGTNAYYLPNYEKLNSGVVDRSLDAFEDAGVNVVRMWAFYDGYDCGYSKQDNSENVIQTSPGEYSERALKDLDRVIAKGKQRGIRFILTFINYWDQLGGVCQYNTWAGASDPSQNMDFFLNNENTQEWFRDYVSMLINRVNTETGVSYKDEPAIFSWQIMNEGRNSGKSPQILRDWYQEIARYIKTMDSKHLVSTGEEGFDHNTPGEYTESKYSNTYILRANEGTSYKMNTAIPEIDFGWAHWYPIDWGWRNSSDSERVEAQEAWLSDHQKIAENHGKPFVIGEYGFPGSDWRPIESLYFDFWDHAEQIKLDGNVLWQLTTSNAPKCREFGGNICTPDDEQLYNSLKSHIQTIKNSN